MKPITEFKDTVKTITQFKDTVKGLVSTVGKSAKKFEKGLSSYFSTGTKNSTGTKKDHVSGNEVSEFTVTESDSKTRTDSSAIQHAVANFVNYCSNTIKSLTAKKSASENLLSIKNNIVNTEKRLQEIDLALNSKESPTNKEAIVAAFKALNDNYDKISSSDTDIDINSLSTTKAQVMENISSLEADIKYLNYKKNDVTEQIGERKAIDPQVEIIAHLDLLDRLLYSLLSWLSDLIAVDSFNLIKNIKAKTDEKAKVIQGEIDSLELQMQKIAEKQKGYENDIEGLQIAAKEIENFRGKCVEIIDSSLKNINDTIRQTFRYRNAKVNAFISIDEQYNKINTNSNIFSNYQELQNKANNNDRNMAAQFRDALKGFVDQSEEVKTEIAKVRQQLNSINLPDALDYYRQDINTLIQSFSSQLDNVLDLMESSANLMKIVNEYNSLQSEQKKLQARLTQLKNDKNTSLTELSRLINENQTSSRTNSEVEKNVADGIKIINQDIISHEEYSQKLTTNADYIYSLSGDDNDFYNYLQKEMRVDKQHIIAAKNLYQKNLNSQNGIKTLA